MVDRDENDIESILGLPRVFDYLPQLERDWNLFVGFSKDVDYFSEPDEMPFVCYRILDFNLKNKGSYRVGDA